MNCLACGEPDSRVLDTRCYDGEAVLRRRACDCGARWTTREVPVARTLTAVPAVVAVRPQRPPATTARTHVLPSTPLGMSISSQPLVVAEVGKAKNLPLASPSGDPDPDRIQIPEAIASGRLKPPRSKASKPAAKPKQDPRVGEVFSLFRPLWQDTYRVSWVPEPGLANNVTAMLRALDEAGGIDVGEIGRWLGVYFDDRTRYVTEARHSLRLFCSQFQKYRAAKPVLSGMSDREIQGVNASFEWLGTTGGKR